MGSIEAIRYIATHQPAQATALSSDGQYLASGTDQGLKLFNRNGLCVLTFPAAPDSLPVQQIIAAPDLRELYVCSRTGSIMRLDLEREGPWFQSQPELLYQTNADTHRIALHQQSQLLAVGHLSAGLSVVSCRPGEVVWRQHADDGTAMEGRFWTVAWSPDGHTLYAGSSGGRTNLLLALDGHSGAVLQQHYLSSRVVGLETLADGSGVVALLVDQPDQMRLVAYQPTLLADPPRWSQDFSEPVTALARDAHEPLLALGVGYNGHLQVIRGHDGVQLAEEALHAMVHDIAFVRGRMLAAATEDAQLALLQYVS